MFRASPLRHHRAFVINFSWECVHGEHVPLSIIVLYARLSHTVLQTAQSYVSFGDPTVVTLHSELGTQQTTPLDRHTHDSGEIELLTQESSNITEDGSKGYDPKVEGVIINNVFLSWVKIGFEL